MRALGMILLTIGFFGSAFFTVRDTYVPGREWAMIEWPLYCTTFLIGALGVVLLRTSSKTAETHSYRVDADMRAMRTALVQIITKLRSMIGGRDLLGVYEVHEKIDADVAADLAAFVDARETLIHLYGLQKYADLMTRFAKAERDINRAWSASADGYVDEVWTCLARAEKQMTNAQTLLKQYQR